ncbi:hypothetical protein NDU88_005748 [Pleurodeles waltl]|uniref:Uncharacterized protein n=1 Tax=Pleurodeles waltl TaxID=8319 RepID=A0AAV7UJ09_PLEWA|nr:hypothetical protein NDU88_005748 [Pleurodeles waltl]
MRSKINCIQSGFTARSALTCDRLNDVILVELVIGSTRFQPVNGGVQLGEVIMALEKGWQRHEENLGFPNGHCSSYDYQLHLLGSHVIGRSWPCWPGSWRVEHCL